MYLKSLSVKNFRKFEDFSINFPSDITVIKGPNEKGKSTILLAILAGLFYDPKKSNKDIEYLKSWNSEKLYDIKLGIENNGEDIILDKKFSSKDILLKNNTTGEELLTYGDVSKYLFDIGSLRSLSLFEKTACVKHDELSLITKGNREISQALQSLLTSSSEDVNTDKIIKKINESLTSINKGLKSVSKTPGEIKQIDNELDELKRKKEEMSLDLDDLSKKTNYLNSLNSEYENLKKEFDLKSRQYEMNLNYFKTMETLEDLNLRYEKINSDIEALEDLNKKKEYILFKLNKMKHLDGFDIQDFYKKINSVKEGEVELERLKRDVESQKHKGEKKSKKKLNFYLSFSVLFSVVGALGIFYSFLFYSFIPAVLFLSFYFFEKSRSGKNQVSLEKKQMADLQKTIKRLSSEIDMVFRKSGVSSVDELMSEIKKYGEFSQELAKIESKQEGILRGVDFKKLKEEKSSILKRIGVEEEKINAEQKTNIPTPQEQRLLEMDLEKIKDKLDDLKSEILQASAVSNQYNIDKEDLVRIEEEIEYLIEKKANLQKRVSVLNELANSLLEAQSNIIAKSKSHIEEYMQRYISTITDGRYDNVKVNDDLSFEVWSEEKKGMLSPENNLSQGTIDQFYLVVRLAILDVLNKGNRSLVLLDDPFHSFDAKRRENTKQVLMDLTDRFQFILFTHSSDYDDWGEVVKI